MMACMLLVQAQKNVGKEISKGTQKVNGSNQVFRYKDQRLRTKVKLGIMVPA